MLLIMSLWGQLYLGLTKLKKVLLKKSIMKQVVFSVASLNIPFDLFIDVTSIESPLQIPRVDVAITKDGFRQMTDVKT